MQITETVSEGLKRELKVVVEAKELDNKLSTRLEELKDRVNIKGFRPGKVPVAHLRRVYGRSVMAEIVQQTVSETTSEALKERNERPAFEPEIALTEDQEEVENIINGKQDLAFTVSFEILPAIELADLSSIELEKEVAEVSEDDFDKALEQISESNTNYSEKDGAAETGDQVVIDFVGKIDGTPFEGGSANDAPVVIGQNAFIPGFEEGLIGAKTDEEKELSITFPEDYPSAELAGKSAVFEVKVKSISAPAKPEINDEFAKNLGLESLEKLNEILKTQIEEQHNNASKTKLKRKVLDALDETHSFELPPTLVEEEFKSIWQQIQSDMEKAKKTFEDEGTTEEKEKEKYQKLAERRVRLGLVLSEIGEKNDIKVSDEEMQQAVYNATRQYPGKEKEVIEMYQKNPQALASLRAPIYEDKVIDFIVALAKVTEKTVETEELYKYPDNEEL